MQNETNSSETRVPSLVQDPRRQLPNALQRSTSPTRSLTWHNNTPHNPASNAPFTQMQRSASFEPIYYSVVATSRQHLNDIVTDSNILPLRVVFCDSIYGFCKNFTFSSDEPFDIHFMKTFLVANVYTNTDKYFEIPLQAPFQFTLSYPRGIKLCNTNHSVSKLLKLDVLPSLVIVKTECKGNCKSSPFVKGEVLVIRGRTKSSTIECVSLSYNGEKKRIHKSSEAVFTINPSRLMIDFADLKYFDLPLQAHIYTSAQDNFQAEFTLLSTIAGLETKRSLIASFSDSHTEYFELYDVFIDTPIDFQRAHCSQADKDKLLEKSKKIFQNFSPVDIKKVIPAEPTDDFIQACFYDFLTHPDKKGKWKQVTKLYQPDLFTHETTQTDTSRSNQESRFNAVPTTNIPTVPPVSTALPLSLSLDSLSRLQRSQPPIPHSKPLPSCKELAVEDSLPMPTKQATKEEEHESTLKLEELSCEQVLYILEQLKLEQYKDSFAKENITGSLLKDFDEEIFNELGITSKLHRIKLMHVIQGKVSLSSFFKDGRSAT